ncbi:MAG TPA: hypothetical protein VM536_12975 [Chloroflexia bacterium]|nr:hypothetical protein [Chloroflexia bacterium]
MPRPGAPLDEGTARFIFQGAVGVGSFCTLASLFLGFQRISLGAAIFLILALLGLGAAIYYGRIYAALRRGRWSQELQQPAAALEQLFDRARADGPDGDAHDPPPEAPKHA